jgi:hypothetical protein
VTHLKKQSINIFLVIVIGIFVGLQVDIKDNPTKVDNEIFSDESMKDKETEITTGLTPKYLIDFLSENGFTVSPVDKGKMSDIYTAKMKVGNTNIVVYVDIYHERKSNQIKLIETTIDGSYYITYSNQKEAEQLVTKVATNYLVPLASIPYHTSKPEEAKNWVKTHIPNSYAQEPKEKTSTKFGLGSLNIYGTPLMRTFEMDFGYGEIEIADTE